MIIIPIAFAIVFVFFSIKKIDLQHKVESYKFLKEISEWEIICDKLSKLSDKETDNLILELENNFKLKK